MDEELINRIREYYLEQEHTREETIKYFNISKHKLGEIIKQNNLYKCKMPKRTKEEQEKINEKRRQTCLKKYGVKYTWQAEEIKERIGDTLEKKYGTRNVREIDEVNEQIKQTCLKKYGGETPFHNQEIQEKATATLCEHYGRRSSTTKLSKKAIEVFSSKENFRDFLLSIPYEKRSLYEIEKRLEYSGALFCRYYHKYNLENIPYKNSNHSRYEEEICDLLKTMNIPFEKGNRKILQGQEIDIYLPDYALGIEFNGSYWHDDEHHPKNYHQEKSLKAKEKGIFIYHIWEDEWKNKKDIIIGQLKELINQSIKIKAQDTEIRQITAQECYSFLNDNWIQGFSFATFYYGLYYKEQLIACMTFEYNSLGKFNSVELLCFCNKKDFIVMDGANKIFEKFLEDNPEINTVISYCDISKTKDDLYYDLKMLPIGTIPPHYRWIDQKTNNFISQYTSQMENENKIMRSKGYVKNYDCGSYKFIWKK